MGKLTLAVLIMIDLSLGVPAHAVRRVVIDTPTPCYKLDRIEAGQVYLRGTEKECPVRGAGKLGLDIDDAVETMVIYLDGARWKEENIPTGFESLQRMNDAATQRQKESAFQKPDLEAARRQAASLKKYLESDEYRQKYSKTADQVIKRLTGDTPSTPTLPETADTDLAEHPKGLSVDERVYLFVSSSMPLVTLRNYAASINRLHERNIFMVLRGPVGGLKEWRKTVAFALGVLKKDTSCDVSREKCPLYQANLIIDPLLFGKYSITGVPAAVYARGVTLTDMEASAGNQANVVEQGDWDIIHGDADLEYLLKRLASDHPGCVLEKILERRIE